MSSTESTHPYIHEAEKFTMVRMHDRGCSAKDSADATGRGYTTVCRALAKHRTTGSVVTRNWPVGRKRILGALDVQVSTLVFNAFYSRRSCTIQPSHEADALSECASLLITSFSLSLYWIMWRELPMQN